MTQRLCFLDAGGRAARADPDTPGLDVFSAGWHVGRRRPPADAHHPGIARHGKPEPGPIGHRAPRVTVSRPTTSSPSFPAIIRSSLLDVIGI